MKLVNAPEAIALLTDLIERVIDRKIVLGIKATGPVIAVIVGRIDLQAIALIELRIVASGKRNAPIVVTKRVISFTTIILALTSGKIIPVGPDIVGIVPIAGQPGA